MRKPTFSICENKHADQLHGNREADQRLCFRYTDSKSLYYINPKFQASSHFLWLYSPVCVGPGRKPRKPIFSQRGSYGKIVKISISISLALEARKMFSSLNNGFSLRETERLLSGNPGNIPFESFTCRTLERSTGKGINTEFPSNKPNRVKRLFPFAHCDIIAKPSDLPILDR